jgi:hypothetical protein
MFCCCSPCATPRHVGLEAVVLVLAATCYFIEIFVLPPTVPAARGPHVWNWRVSLAMTLGIERTRTKRPASSKVSERTRAFS